MTTPALIEALAIAELPDVQWQQGDDLCDCTFQRIGWWTNPYLAETLEVRMCCIWAELYKQFPEHVRMVPGFWDYNRNEWVTEPRKWDGETAMPRALWLRQLARQQGLPLADVREAYSTQEPPSGRAERVPFVLLVDGNEVEVNLRSMRRA